MARNLRVPAGRSTSTAAAATCWVFGFGWPVDASKTIYDAIDGSGGSYLVAKDAAG
jgi:hypothetical protein